MNHKIVVLDTFSTLILKSAKIQQMMMSFHLYLSVDKNKQN